MDVAPLDAAQALILVLGSVIVYYASLSYRRTKSQAMLLLAVGFAFVALGAFVAGVLFNFYTSNLYTVETVQAYCQGLGFIMIVYSLAKAKG